MSIRRNAALVSLGMVVGAMASALIVLYFFKDRSDDKSVKENAKKEQGSINIVDSVKPTAIDVDYSGDGVLSGVVKDTDGNAVKGALVKIRLTDQPWSCPDLPFETKTDSLGRFSFPGLSTELNYQVFAFAEGSAVSSARVTGCEDEVELILQEGASIEVTFDGEVFRKERKIKLQLAGTGIWPIREIDTNVNGSLSIEGLIDGEYVLWIESQGLAYVSPKPIVVEIGQTAAVSVELVPEKTSRIRVVDENGTLLKEPCFVTLLCSTSGLIRRTIAVPAGQIVVVRGLVPQEYQASAFSKGYVQTEPIVVRPGDDAVMKMVKGARVQGFVRAKGGEPIEGAKVETDQEMGQAAVSGVYPMGRLFRKKVLEDSASGWPRMFEFERGRICSGPRRMPLPDLISKAGNSAAWEWGVTSANGEFVLDGLPSGKLLVFATHPDYVTSKKTEVTLEQGKALDNVIVVMRPGSSVSLRTVDERGFPVPECEIQIFDETDMQIASAVSGSDGGAEIKGLPGVFRIESVCESRVPAVKDVKGLSGQSLQVSLTMPAADKTIFGRVTDTDGFGIKAALIAARSVNAKHPHVLTTVTRDDGTFTLEGAGIGRYHITAIHDELGAARFNDALYKDNVKLVLKKETVSGSPVHIEPTDTTGDYDDDTLITLGGADNLGEVQMQDQVKKVESKQVEINGDDFGDAEQLPVTGPPVGRGGLPITLGGGSGKVVVRSVSPGSQVAEAGISKGDRILSIDGRKVSGPAEAERAILGNIGTIITLEVEGADGLYTIVVQRVRVSSGL